MAEKISPGVFTRENDKSFLATGISQIGAAVIGPTEIGPAFIPTPITNANEFEAIFGPNSDKTYVPYTVQNYLKSAGVVHVVRVLGTEGWKSSFNRVQGQNNYIKLIIGGTTAAVLAVTSGSQNFNVAGITVSGTGYNFTIASGSTTVACSFSPGSSNYILKVFGSDPYNKFGNELSSNLYCYQLFSNFVSSPSVLSSPVSMSFGNLEFNLNAEYSPARTPWVQSQKIGNISYNLFRFVTLSDGTNANKLVKVSIENITKPTTENSYGSFNVVVRDFNDTDLRPSVLEVFQGCNLDPTSPKYILKMIGNKYKKIDSNGKVHVFGEYDNKSKYIRVEAADGLESLSKDIVPFGHSAYYNPVEGNNFPVVPKVQYQGPNSEIYNSKYYWGIDTLKSDFSQFCMPIMDNASINVGSAFSLDDYNGHINSSYTGSLSNISAPKEMLKFTMVFQGGWDGIPPNRAIKTGASITSNNVFGFDCSTATSPGTVAFKRAIDAVSNPDEFDINMILIPGIMQNYHPHVVNHAINMCEERQDTFYILDCVGLNDSIDEAVSSVASLDSNYAATYYPWVKISDPVRNKGVWVPPSVVLGGVIAFNDKISAPWYAPAGLNRGGLTNVIDVARLTASERDKLYEGRVNPIAMFPGQGPSVWGQKTLQRKASALDRINVRRLLIEIKKFFASTSRYIVFEPNTNQTRQQFLQIVNPYMESIQRRSGIYWYKIVLDETNNTPDVIDRNVLVGSLYIRPTKAAEFIEWTFNILPTGAVFE